MIPAMLIPSHVALLTVVAVAEGDREAPLEAASSAFAAAQFERAIVLAAEALDQSSLSLVERGQAHVIRGSALVVVGEFLGAEKEFRKLLRLAPEYDLQEDLSPKIVAVFRKVQAEERELRESMDRVRFQRAQRSLELVDTLPTRGEGGKALPLRVRIKDPMNAISSVAFFFRGAQSEAAFLRQPLERDALGAWSTELTAEMTSNQNGMILESFLRVSDDKNRVLREFNDATQPHRIVLTAGDTSPPFYRRTWFWAVTTASVAALGGLSTYFIYEARQPPDSQAGIWRID